MKYDNGSENTEFLHLGFCISRIVSLELCFNENYGCYEVAFGVKITARPFSTPSTKFPYDLCFCWRRASISFQVQVGWEPWLIGTKHPVIQCNLYLFLFVFVIVFVSLCVSLLTPQYQIGTKRPVPQCN